MKNNGIKWFYGVFLGIFIIVGLALLILGLTKLAQYNSANEIDATVISAEYNFEQSKIKVIFEFELNGERLTTSLNSADDIKYDKDGRLPYYEGLQTKIRIDNKNQIVTYGKTEIITIAAGGLFSLFGIGFLYFFVLRKRTLFDIAYDYEKAIVSPEDLNDDTVKYEAAANDLSKLPEYSAQRIVGESKVWTNRIADRFKSFTITENIIYSLIPVGLIVLFWIVFKMGALSIFCGLFAFGFGGLLLKAVYGAYIKISVKRGKFSEKKLATVKLSVFESEVSFKTGDLSRNYMVYKKFRVVAIIDGKRSVGYVLGTVPPPKGCILKVLVRPRRSNRFIIASDDTEI